MQSTTPQLVAHVVRVAEHQAADGFVPINAALVKHPDYWTPPKVDVNTHVLAFRPTDEERARIAAGADLYVGLLTYGGPMQGIIVATGKEEAAAIYHVRTKEGA